MPASEPVPAVTPQQVAEQIRSLYPRWLKIWPLPKQAVFLLLTVREALFGGSAGGGKTFALLQAALQYADVPEYAAIIYRRTYPELSLPGGLIDTSKKLLAGIGSYNEQRHEWRFPAGSILRFGHMQHLRDVERHERGPQYQFIGFDELTTFREAMYRRMFSRLRGPSEGPLSRVPLRMRAATNPGGEGHDWVRRRFLVEGPEHGRVFVPARFRENVHLDHDEYLKSLEELDPVSRARMLEGDWDVQDGGSVFSRGWFEVLDEAPPVVRSVRFWDCAASTGEDAAFTAGVLMGVAEAGRFVVLDVRRFKRRPGERDALILETAREDGAGVPVRVEQEPGGGGVHQAQDQVRMLAGYDVQAVRPLGSKVERAAPLARQAQIGNVAVVSAGAWVGAYLDELVAFPDGRYKDQVDATSGALHALTVQQSARAAVRSEAERVTPRPRVTSRLFPTPRRRL